MIISSKHAASRQFTHQDNHDANPGASLASFEPIIPQRKSPLLTALLEQGVVIVKNTKPVTAL